MPTLRSLMLLVAVLPITGLSQAPDTVWIPNDHSVGTINDVIQGDTLSNGLRVNPSRVYMLHRGGYYALNGALTTKAGTRLCLEGESAPASGEDPGMAVLIEGTVPGVYYNHIIDNYGDISLKNIWLLYVTDTGSQDWTDLSMQSDSTHGYFENCIFDWAMGICVMAYGKGIDLTFRNCIFRNTVDGGQWWAGRQLATALSSATLDSVISTNCTFENMGFTFQSDYAPPRYVLYDHNTFLNIAKFAFKIYWMTHLIATNNIFVNCHFTGERKADRMGQDPDMQLYGAVLNIDTIPPGVEYNGVAELDRVVNFSNNSNYRQQAFQSFYDAYNVLDSAKGPDFHLFAEPMLNDRTRMMFTWHPNFRFGINYDSTDPGFVVPATNLDSITAFLYDRYVSGGTCFWGFNPDLKAIWPLIEDLSYTNRTLLTAGVDGLPLGDLYHWFPEKYAHWASLTSVKQTSNKIPLTMQLEQNYPNPFNPTTVVSGHLAVDSWVKLEVYDVLGKRVATLANGKLHSGRFAFVFDARRLASGVYLSRLSADGLVSTKSMILIK